MQKLLLVNLMDFCFVQLQVFICVLSLASYVSAGFLAGGGTSQAGYSYSAPQLQQAPVYSGKEWIKMKCIFRQKCLLQTKSERNFLNDSSETRNKF